MTPIRFEGRNAEFFSTLRTRINDYFTENNIKPTGNWKLYSKTIILGTLLGLNYASLYIVPADSNWIYVVYATIGIWFAGIGFNVMHDGAHGSYSDKTWVNKLMAVSLNLLGGNAFIWAEKHNIAHHSFTNIEGVDDDIDLWPILRVNTSKKKLWFHKFQHIYGIPLYFVAYLTWIFIQDFKKYFSGKVIDRPFKTKFGILQHIEFWSSKIVYITIFFFLPAFAIGFKTAIIGFILMGALCGILITVVFQLAHVVEETTYVTDLEVAKRNHQTIDAIHVADDWATHQIHTTSNFSTKSKFLTWALGGLNFQVEHHLFPKISHVHYPKINEIVKKTCADFNVKYNEVPTFLAAIRSHLAHLKTVGSLA
jgi:linoleoyl-CoA desaturase